ncbi:MULTISPECIES: helix-turn-helix transcriptional regulator [Clostridium]|uniref:helix-turn-helix transcriptional regulator n=1 Tax=Clostridium TaxID=1485 RepID=UPI0002E882EB|nr:MULTISPECIES: helix-turn-helix domain-containing protein [Clostridium]MBA8932365.1 putative transcriptional regulator [Clostridium beijerinckii]NRT37664.1 putative transcriptional regulator [Clostridium beijerinckii]NRT48592.1 putative transcriptional regulator [Clostridium beijerinckii]NRU36569.1 putative transcriptional regulator [Clostridium beijerinckii]NRZ23111.1 putative transcriptional regulator [Clostridium beijerinckii]
MYSKLKGLMVEKRITQQKLAEVLKITGSALNYKINGKSDFSVTEAKLVSTFFGKTIEEIFVIDEVNNMKTSRSA